MSVKKNNFLISLLFLLALFLRVYGLNWDQSQHLHPDERFLTMVANDIKIPSSVFQYFDTQTSPLNPYNYSQYQFFVYGTFPLFLVKFISSVFRQDNYSQVFLWGRGLSALFDSLNIILLCLISKKIFNKKNIFIFLPSLLYTFCLLPLQLSHFFAVDTFLNTFLLAAFTALTYDLFPLAAIFFGFALASKITAFYFIPVIVIYIFKQRKNIFNIILYVMTSFIVVRIFQPYSFSGLLNINPHFLSSLKSLSAYDNRQAWYPPGVQWLSKTPFLFSLKNLFFWGLGLPLSILFIFSFSKTVLQKKPFAVLIALFWVVTLYLLQGSQFVQTLRYFIIIVPLLCLVVGYLSQSLNNKLLLFLVICHISFGLLFLSIYSRPHSRIQASEWIDKNLPADSTLTNEYWDDSLPLYLPTSNNSHFNQITLSFFDPDSPEKWQKINSDLNKVDYLVMSSNRLWGSMPLVPERYPITSQFYKNLFAGKLNFSKLIEINSYPGISLPFLHQCYYFGPTNFSGIKNSWFSIDKQCFYPGIYLRDDTAEEVFTVYDHPKVLIFRKNQ